MRRLLKYTAILLMVLMTGSSVWAFSYSDHVTTAPNNKGDVLIFPWFLSLDGGWQTKLTVINTNSTNAVVAKVVLRSFKNSEELIDFFIYLSASDVWTGIIKKTGGVTVITSSDDSVLYSASPLVFADVTPISQPMFGLDCPSQDADFLGYVEVIMAAFKPGQTLGTTKDKIYRGYRDTAIGNEGGPPVTTTGSESIGTMYIPGSVAGLTQINPNSLAGYMELQNATLGLSTSLKSTTLKDYYTNAKLTTADETRLGESSRNTLMEVEDALSINNIAMPYVNATDIALHFLTFPTKLTQRTKSDCTFLDPLSPFFDQNSLDKAFTQTNAWCVAYGVRPYDLREHAPSTGPFSGGGSSNSFCNEVNFISSAVFPYTEGWASYFISSAADGITPVFTVGSTKNSPGVINIDSHGAPVIPTFIYLGGLGLSANYGAWSNTPVHGITPAGVVTHDLIEYQYTDSAVVTLP